MKRIYRIWIQRLGKLTLSILQTRKVLSQFGCGRSICQLYLDLLNLIIHLRFICSILGEECHSHRIIRHRHQECHVHRITSQPSSSASTEHRNLANVIVSSNNPLLRRSQRFAELHRGTQVFIGSTEAANQVPIYSNQQKRVICLDYHQVLDRVRGGRNRPDLFLVDEALHPFVQRYLELLGRRFEVWVVSFCCSGYYRNRVKTNCNLPGVSRVILTSERASRGGKLDAVRAQLTPECLASCFIIDDDRSVNTEWFAASRDGICSEPAGIAVPRKPRADGVTYYPNFGDCNC